MAILSLNCTLILVSLRESDMIVVKRVGTFHRSTVEVNKILQYYPSTGYVIVWNTTEVICLLCYYHSNSHDRMHNWNRRLCSWNSTYRKVMHGEFWVGTSHSRSLEIPTSDTVHMISY